MDFIYILQQIYPCILYGLVSVQLTFAMKLLLQGRQHLGLNTALGYQQIVIIILCQIIDKYFTKKTAPPQPSAEANSNSDQTESVKNSTLEKLSALDRLKKEFNERKDMFLFSIVYFLSTVTGTKAHSSLPIPMFLALRRTLIFFVFIATIILGQKKQQHNTQAKASIFLITFGALFAGLQSFDSNIFGYILCFFNNSLSAVGLQLSKNYNDKQKISPYQIVVKNSLNILPFFILISFSTGELLDVLRNDEIYHLEVFLWLNYVAVLGFLHQYSTNLCSAKCSPLALAVTQSVKDLISTIASLLFFRDMEINVYSLGGLITSFLGSFFFIYNKYKEVQIEFAKKQQEDKQKELLAKKYEIENKEEPLKNKQELTKQLLDNVETQKSLEKQSIIQEQQIVTKRS